MTTIYEKQYEQHISFNKLIQKQIYLKDIIDVNYLFYMEIQPEIYGKYNYDYFYNNKFTYLKNVKYTPNKEVFFFDDENKGLHFYIVVLYEKEFDRLCFLRYNQVK